MLSILTRIQTETPAPPSKHRLDVAPELEAICLKAMARNADDRFPSMAELAEALSQHFDETRDLPGPAPIPAAEPGSAGSGDPASTLPLLHPAAPRRRSPQRPFPPSPKGLAKRESGLDKPRPPDPVDSDFLTTPVARIELRRVPGRQFPDGLARR